MALHGYDCCCVFPPQQLEWNWDWDLQLHTLGVGGDDGDAELQEATFFQATGKFPRHGRMHCSALLFFFELGHVEKVVDDYCSLVTFRHCVASLAGVETPASSEASSGYLEDAVAHWSVDRCSKRQRTAGVSDDLQCLIEVMSRRIPS
jgi:hypothetical protein